MEIYLTAKKTVKAKEPVRIRFKELKNGNKSIYLDIYRDGKRTYEFLKLYIVPELDPASRALNEHNLALANKVKADRIIQLTNNEKGVTNSMLHSRMKLIDLINMYEQWIKDNGKSMGSSGLASLRKAVTQFRGDGVTLKQVDKTYCIEFINYLRNDYKSRMKRPLSTNSIASYSAALSATFNWAVRHDYIKENPFDKLSSNDRVYHVESQRDYLEIDELKRLIATECPTRQSVKQAFLFSCYCGLRTSDIRALRWGQIHKDGDQWRVSVVMKKTARPIYLPLSSQAMKWLPERGDASDDDKVFSLPTTSRVSIILGNWAKAANVKKEITFHVSRHTFATLMLTLDVDLYTTSKLLGHKNIATTQIYAKIIDQKKDDAVNFYSVQLDEEELSELEKFFEKFPEGSEYDHDIDTIIAWLDRIGESGALERYFRYEGRFGDGVSAIPVETSNLRLYCIRLSDKILVFGNGGVKDCATWQESETLAEYVEMLVDTSRFISSRLSNGTLYIVDKEIIGNLNFTRDEKK